MALVMAFPWSLSVLIIAIAAMILFRQPISELIDRIREVKFKAGRFSLTTSRLDSEVVAQINREVRESAAAQDEADLRRLAIRDSNGRVRILASTVETGAPYLALIDEDQNIRVALVASPATELDAVAMLTFYGIGQRPDEMGALIGAERDGSGTVGMRNSSGEWKEIL